MMKIPETPANVGAYYGNEENGQWQANGVIYDGGIGGGVVGSGDAPRPLYPVHVSRHIPGYVMAGAYYGAGAPAAAGGYGAPPAHPGPPPHGPPQDDFADYMWMENEEEFDKQVMQQLEEEALMEQCIEAMLEDEQRERRRPRHGKHNNNSNGAGPSLEETVSRSTLNPLAAEFVPICRATAPKEEKPEPPPPEVSAAAALDTRDTLHTPATPATRDTPVTQPTDTQPTDEPGTTSGEEASPAPVIEKKDTKRDAKRPSKSQEPKKSKQPQPPTAPQSSKSDSKVQPTTTSAASAVAANTTTAASALGLGRKARVTNSDSGLTETDAAEEVVKAHSQPSQPEEPTPAGPKPINYAAAARANKPKPKTTEKTPPPSAAKPDKPVEKKVASKPDKPAQRKNSAK